MIKPYDAHPVLIRFAIEGKSPRNKSDGTDRPIGIFGSLSRLFGAAYKRESAIWESKVNRNYFYAGPGRSAEAAAPEAPESPPPSRMASRPRWSTPARWGR